MSDFISNSNTYNIITETELSEILSHYNSEFVLSVVEEAMNKRFVEYPYIPMPNVVAAWEANFKLIMNKYNDLPEAKTEVPRVRSETYIEIIDLICRQFDLQFTEDQNIDLYSAANLMYDFFVCKFLPYMTDFFAKYIYTERNSLYESLHLSDYKKNKDSSTIYGKKIYKDVRMAVVNANVGYIVEQMESFDIDLSTIFQLSLPTQVANYMDSLLLSNSDFYHNYYVSLLKTDMKAPILSEIILKLRQISGSDDVQIDYVEEDITE